MPDLLRSETPRPIEQQPQKPARDVKKHDTSTHEPRQSIRAKPSHPRR
jgi:hypothetical protein